MIFQAEQRV